jgi:non-heme chloroperoxidase
VRSHHENPEVFTSHDDNFRTSDGADIHFIDIGRGRPLVMIPGWSQTAEMFKNQYLPLSKHFRCVAVDMRGHGESKDLDFGFTIDRLAQDLHELVDQLELEKPIFLGHSMGASVLWAYTEKYGSTNISKMIFVDQPPILLSGKGWTEHECRQYGAIFDTVAVDELCGRLRGKEAIQATRKLLRNMFTSAYTAEALDWVLSENLKLRRDAAAALLRDHCSHDWRETIKVIEVPCLVIGGEVSIMPWQSQHWIGEQIADAKVVLFNEHDGGQHFMFLENPKKFNKIICNFCQ